MEKVKLFPLVHKGKQWMAIQFDRNNDLNKMVRQIAGIKYTATHKCWITAITKEKYEYVCSIFKNHAEIDNAAMKKWGNAKLDVILPNMEEVSEIILPTKTISYAINKNVLPKLKQHLQLKAYSTSTIKTYMSEMGSFLTTIKNNSADGFSVQRIKDYLQYCYETLKLSENTLHSRINALKFYYEQVLKRENFFWEIPRPKKPFQIPNFFNQDEIVAILKSTVNLKHKTMLMLAYSSGLRVSEAVSIKTRNIDSKRMCIKIEQGKGKKDRMVMLSPLLLIMLREYWKIYKTDKTGFLFEGQIKGTAYSSRSLQEVLTTAKKKAGILKPGSIHALRHSFATHLLDKGTDISMIQKLLGHNDINTTLRYLHTSNKDLLNILSPLDSLNLD